MNNVVRSLCQPPRYPSRLGPTPRSSRKVRSNTIGAMKHSAGNLKEWKCGSEVSEVKTDQAGNFTIVGVQPGKYCVDITGPQPENDNECGSYNGP